MTLKITALALSMAVALSACSKKEETVLPETSAPVEQAAPQAVLHFGRGAVAPSEAGEEKIERSYDRIAFFCN